MMIHNVRNLEFWPLDDDGIPVGESFRTNSVVRTHFVLSEEEEVGVVPSVREWEHRLRLNGFCPDPPKGMFWCCEDHQRAWQELHG